jgi:phosphatidylserine synthase
VNDVIAIISGIILYSSIYIMDILKYFNMYKNVKYNIRHKIVFYILFILFLYMPSYIVYTYLGIEVKFIYYLLFMILIIIPLMEFKFRFDN